MQSTTIPLKLPETYKKYLDYLSDTTQISKKSIIETSLLWYSKQLTDGLDIPLSYNHLDTRYVTISINCSYDYKKLLDDITEQLNLTRYDLTISLINYYHNLIESELYHVLSYEDFLQILSTKY